jgi:thiol-disulfide isomerase/thioredoxin
MIDSLHKTRAFSKATKLYAVLILFLLHQHGYGQQEQINFDSLVSARQKEITGKPFPLFTASLQKRIFGNRDIKGKVVFINFWFANCPPCIAEMDALNDLYKKLKKNKQFEFLSFTYESPETVKRLVKKYSLPYKVFSISQQECYRLNQNNAFPTSIVLDKNGIIQMITFGGTTDRVLAKKNVLTTYYQQILKQL